MGYQMSAFYGEGSPYQLSVYQGKFHFQKSSSLLLTMVVQCAKDFKQKYRNTVWTNCLISIQGMNNSFQFLGSCRY